MRVAFRIDSSPTIGLGHINRTLVLAEEFKKNKVKVFFLNSNFKKNYDNLIKKKGFNLIKLNDNEISEKSFNETAISEDSKKVSTFVKKNKIDLTIIDNYLINAKWEEEVSKNCKIILISDFLKRKTFCDYLIQYHLSSENNFKKYLLNKNCKVLSDPQYTIIKKQPIPKILSQNRKKVFIYMGGADSKFFTEKIIKILNKKFFYKYKFFILVKKERAKSVKKLCAKNNNFIILSKHYKNLSSLAAKCSIIISNMGTSMYEFSKLRAKLIIVPQSDTHKRIAANLKNFDLFDIVYNLKKLKNKKLFYISKEDLVKSNNRQSIYDGKGSERIVKLLLSNFNKIKLTNYLNSDKYFLFNLVNDARVRAYSFNKKKISFRNHVKWLKKILINKNNKIMIFIVNKIRAGQVRVEKDSSGYKLDYSISNEFRGMNFGSKMLNLFIKSSNLSNIYALTKKNNFSSIKCLQKVNFSKVSSKKYLKFNLNLNKVN